MIHESTVNVKSIPAVIYHNIGLPVAYQYGKYDASSGEPFAPELVWGKGINRYNYTIGFLAIRPDCQPAEAYAKQYEDEQYEAARLESDEIYDQVNAWQG